MAKILIVGVGDVGARVASLLLAAGHEVWGLRRHPERSELPAHPRLSWLACDVLSLSAEQLPPALDAAIVALAPSGHELADYDRSYRQAAEHLATVLQPLRLQWLAWLSSTSVYGQHQGEWVDELSPTMPTSAKAQRLLAAEQAIAAGAEHVTVLRLSGLYGPGRLRLVKWVQSGKPVVRAAPQWSNRVHVSDVAAALVHLLDLRLSGHLLRSGYVLTDQEPTPQHEVLDWLAKRLGAAPVPEASAAPESGKRLRSRYWQETGYVLQYGNYRTGYGALLDSM